MIRSPRTSGSEPRREADLEEMQASRGRPKSRRTPELEIIIGQRIRAARISVGLSQIALGTAIGVSFQQIAKYEKGFDRIAASTLQTLATALGVHPGSFYDDSPLPAGSIADMKAALEKARVLQHIRDPDVARQLLALARVLAQEAPQAAVEVAQPLKDGDGPR